MKHWWTSQSHTTQTTIRSATLALLIVTAGEILIAILRP